MKRNIYLQEAAINALNVLAEIIATEKLLIRDALAHIGCEDVFVPHEDHENFLTGELIMLKMSTEVIDADELGPGLQDQNHVVMKEKKRASRVKQKNQETKNLDTPRKTTMNIFECKR